MTLAAQAVTEPGTHAGLSQLLSAGVDERDGRIMVDRFRIDGANDCEVVDD